MPEKTLDASSFLEMLYDTDTPYDDGEQYWAARSNWYIRFWGYVFTEIPQGSTVDPGTGRQLMFIDSDDNKLTMRGGSTFNKFSTEKDNKRYSLLVG